MNVKRDNKIAPKDMDSQSRGKWAKKHVKEIVGRYPVFKDEPTGVISGSEESIEEELEEESNIDKDEK